MVQAVFVHGVATRGGSIYAAESENREALFRAAAFKGRQFTLAAPLWGNLVPSKAWGGQCFPKFGQDQVRSFSLIGGLGAASPDGGSEAMLGEIAFSDPNVAVDTLIATDVENSDEAGRRLSAEQIADFVAATARMTEGGFSRDIALAQSSNDFVDRVRTQMGAPNSYGFVDGLTTAASSVVGRARNLVGDGLVYLFRDALNPKVAEFLGDVFIYLKAGVVRENIRAIILPAILKAYGRRGDGEALILIGHSLGGVILYDILTSDEIVWPEGFQVDLLLTAGSQAGLFEELKLFDGSDPSVMAPTKVLGPEPVNNWMNVYDPIDLFGFRAEPIFQMAKDFKFDSACGLLDAHTTYFKRPQFHARLRSRLDDLGLK